MTDDERTIRRVRETHSDGQWDVHYEGQTTAPERCERRWPGPDPEAVITDMNRSLGEQPPEAYRVVEGA
jgi:hypothetical protein